MSSTFDKPRYPKCPVSGKHCYSMREAQGVKNYHKKKDGIEMRIYDCTDCGRYHLSSQVYNKDRIVDEQGYPKKINHRTHGFRKRHRYETHSYSKRFNKY